MTVADRTSATDPGAGFDLDSYDPASYDPRSPEVKQEIEHHFRALRATAGAPPRVL